MTMTKDRPAAATAAARRAMIDSQLRTSGVNEPWVLNAMASVAREDFVPAAMKQAAYIDRAIALDDGSMLAAPLVHARMLAEAAPGADDKALLVGGANGYLAALLRPLVGTLDTLAPGEVAGKARKGPYSLIVVDGAIGDLPPALASRLTADGRIVTGVVERGVTRLAMGRKVAGNLALLALTDLGIPELPELAASKRWSF